MRVPAVINSDGVEIAGLVRSLARQARWAFDHPDHEDEARDLGLAIETLEAKIEPGSSGRTAPLARKSSPTGR